MLAAVPPMARPPSALVTPLPDMVPSVQVVAPVIVRLSEPVSVPPLSVNWLVVKAAPVLKLTVPPLIVMPVKLTAPPGTAPVKLSAPPLAKMAEPRFVRGARQVGRAAGGGRCAGDVVKPGVGKRAADEVDRAGAGDTRAGRDRERPAEAQRGAGIRGHAAGDRPAAAEIEGARLAPPAYPVLLWLNATGLRHATGPRAAGLGERALVRHGAPGRCSAVGVDVGVGRDGEAGARLVVQRAAAQIYRP